MSWNKNSAKVIGITAAAAMALSLAPATAFTAYAAPRNGSSVSEQAIGPDVAFSQGKVTAATVNGQNATVKDGKVSAEYTGKQLKVVPSVVTLPDGSTIDLGQLHNGNLLGSDQKTYTLGGDFEETNRGNYTVTLSRPGASLSFEFDITPTDLSGVVAKSASDLTYNTHNQTVQFEKNGVTLNPATDYNVYYYSDAGHTVPLRTALHDAGTYYAELQGKGNYGKDGNKYIEVAVVIKPLDLSKATVDQSDLSGNTMSSTDPTTDPGVLNGIKVKAGSVVVTGSELMPTTNPDAKLTWTSGPNGNHSFMNTGAYVYTLSPVSKNVVNSADLHFNKVDKVLDGSNFTYDSNAWSNPVHLHLDQATPDKFDENKIKVSGVDPNTGRTVNLTKDQYTVSYERNAKMPGDTNDNWVASSLSEMNSQAGQYRVKVVVNADKTNYVFGGNSGYLDVQTLHQTGARVYVSVNGKLVGWGTHKQTVNRVYNGKAVNVSVKVLSNYGNHAALVEGKDYTVAYKKQTPEDSAGQYSVSADQILNAGNYEVLVTAVNPGLFFQNPNDPSHYTSSTDQTKVNIEPMHVKATDLKNVVSYMNNNETDRYHFAYRNGSQINPVVIFESTNLNQNPGEKNGVVEVPSSAYVLSYAKDGKSVNGLTDNGDYTLYIDDANDFDNYVVGSRKFPVTVTSARYFEDVPADSYYNPFIYDLANKGIMTGIGKTDLFGFHWAYTRGQAITVLYRLARSRALPDGNKVLSTANEVATRFENNHNTVKMPFDDVDPNTFYSAPVVWGKQIGLITGYAGTKNFEPNKSVSAEELATMLDRYAKQVDPDYKAGDESVLSNYTDASKVSAFARSHVAWAVTNKMMGQGTKQLDPQNSIERWRVATIISRSGLADNNKPLA